MKYVRRRLKQDDWRLIATMPYTMCMYREDSHILTKTSLGWAPTDEVSIWCNENFGEFPRSWAYDASCRNAPVFHFTRKDHAMAFKLRWC